VPRQLTFQPSHPELLDLLLRVHPLHLVGQFAFPGRGRIERPEGRLLPGRQFRDHRGVLAVMLAGNIVEHLAVIAGRLGTHPVQRQARIMQCLP